MKNIAPISAAPSTFDPSPSPLIRAFAPDPSDPPARGRALLGVPAADAACAPTPGVMASLSAAQRDQLHAWLDQGHSFASILRQVNAPPPEGFGLHLHKTSLLRYAARWKAFQILQED